MIYKNKIWLFGSENTSISLIYSMYSFIILLNGFLKQMFLEL